MNGMQYLDLIKIITKYKKDILNFLDLFFKGEEAEEFVAFAYITGILPIKKYGRESELNNFEEYTMVDPANMVDCIGFTEDEVMEL